MQSFNAALPRAVALAPPQVIQRRFTSRAFSSPHARMIACGRTAAPAEPSQSTKTTGSFGAEVAAGTTRRATARQPAITGKRASDNFICRTLQPPQLSNRTVVAVGRHDGGLTRRA